MNAPARHRGARSAQPDREPAPGGRVRPAGVQDPGRRLGVQGDHRRLTDQFDALIGKWSFGWSKTSTTCSTPARAGRAPNIFNYSNPNVDELLQRYNDAHTDTEAQDAYHDLHALLADELPYIFLWKLDTKSAWRNEIKNGTITPFYYFTEFDGWRL
jgi:ABC-type transport system substrate-binding protein